MIFKRKCEHEYKELIDQLYPVIVRSTTSIRDWAGRIDYIYKDVSGTAVAWRCKSCNEEWVEKYAGDVVLFHGEVLSTPKGEQDD